MEGRNHERRYQGRMAARSHCSDILVVSESAFLSGTEVDVGLAGGVRHAMRHIGQSGARLMIYTARRIIGPELLRMNVVSARVPGAELMGLALGIAGKVPLALRAARRSFAFMREPPLREGDRYEQPQTAALSTTDDTKEAQRAFTEKRPRCLRDISGRRATQHMVRDAPSLLRAPTGPAAETTHRAG